MTETVQNPVVIRLTTNMLKIANIQFTYELQINYLIKIYQFIHVPAVEVVCFLCSHKSLQH